LEPWQCFQEWLKDRSNKVEIPYNRTLIENIAPEAIRLRRDVHIIQTLIKTHAFLHQMNRPIRSGTIIANMKDYEIVRTLINDIISEGARATVSPKIRETVEAVNNILFKTKNLIVSQKELTDELKLDKSAVSRRVWDAKKEGYLKDLNDRKGRPSELQVGDPLPEGTEVLPEPDKLSGCTVARENEGNTTEDEVQESGVSTKKKKGSHPWRTLIIN